MQGSAKTVGCGGARQLPELTRCWDLPLFLCQFSKNLQRQEKVVPMKGGQRRCEDFDNNIQRCPSRALEHKCSKRIMGPLWR